MKKVYFVGIDQHKKVSTLHVRGADGKTVRSFGIRHDRLQGLRSTLSALDGTIHASMEATGFYWWMVQELRNQGVHVHLAHPGALKMIFKAKNKTDKNDAERISKLLWLGELPESYIPTQQEARIRELLGTRRLLVKIRGQMCCRIHQLFAKLNEPVPTRGFFYSSKNLNILKTVNLPQEWGESLGHLVQSLQGIQDEIKACEKRIEEFASTHELSQWIDQVDGFAAVGSATVAARIGSFERFANRRAVASYFGLTPKIDNSADTKRSGHIDKMGPAEVRKVLVQAVHCMVRTRPAAREYLDYLCRRVRPCKALVAMARRLIVGLRAARVKGEAFDLAKCFKLPETRSFQGRSGTVTLVPVKRAANKKLS